MTRSHCVNPYRKETALNPIMEKMKASKVVVGMTMAELMRPPVVKIYANAGADFMYI